MKKIFSLLMLLAMLLAYGESDACTSAILLASRSSERVPMLWKHRDSPSWDCHVEYIEDGKYGYTALVSPDRKYTYCGINEKGFAVMNTVSENLTKSKIVSQSPGAISSMTMALRECATVDEFEELLRNSKRGRKAKMNLGVGDATGAVAYFEVWDLGYRRYDVANHPEGFDVRANFSHARIKEEKGASERRYNLIMNEMGNHNGNFSPWDFVRYSRSYNSVKYGNVLNTNDRYRCANHTVARATSVGAFVIVCDGNNPRMLAMNGHPVSSIAVPIYVRAKHEIPKCVSGSAMQELSREFKAKAYVKITKTGRYLNKELVRNVLNIKLPKIEMPKQMPANIQAFNKKIDKLYAKHEKRVRKVLNME